MTRYELFTCSLSVVPRVHVVKSSMFRPVYDTDVPREECTGKFAVASSPLGLQDPADKPNAQITNHV